MLVGKDKAFRIGPCKVLGAESPLLVSCCCPGHYHPVSLPEPSPDGGYTHGDTASCHSSMLACLKYSCALDFGVLWGKGS